MRFRDGLSGSLMRFIMWGGGDCSFGPILNKLFILGTNGLMLTLTFLSFYLLSSSSSLIMASI